MQPGCVKDDAFKSQSLGNLWLSPKCQLIKYHCMDCLPCPGRPCCQAGCPTLEGLSPSIPCSLLKGKHAAERELTHLRVHAAVVPEAVPHASGRRTGRGRFGDGRLGQPGNREPTT